MKAPILSKGNTLIESPSDCLGHAGSQTNPLSDLTWQRALQSAFELKVSKAHDMGL